MNGTKNYSAWQFTAFRIIFGSYLSWHFAALLPYAGELFSGQGVLPQNSLNFTYKLFPNVLAISPEPILAKAFIALLLLCAISFAVGWWRRSCALLLWYGWACLFNRNNLISNPGIPYVGLLLVFSALVPLGEPLALGRKRDHSWRMPALIYWGAWFVLAAGYTYSGEWKLISPSWQDGSALHHLITNPLARPGFFRNALLEVPPPVLAGLTWVALAGEVLALPLSFWRKGRLASWVWMVAMHLGILLVVDFADLTMGMLMIHLFTFDPEWLMPRFATKPILLFDGECALCNAAVQFFMREDTYRAMRYASLQSERGREFLMQHGLQGIDSMVLIEEPSTSRERAFVRSTAALRALAAIGGIWKAARVGFLIPPRPRDKIYDFVARKRYEWFGRAEESCLVAGPESRQLIVG